MNAKKQLLAAAAAAAIGLGTSGSVMADDYRGAQHQHRYEYQHKHHQQYRYYHHHWKHSHRRHGYVARERVVVERPVYVERYVRYAPPPRHPGVVVRVDFPPLVFGLH